MTNDERNDKESGKENTAYRRMLEIGKISSLITENDGKEENKRKAVTQVTEHGKEVNPKEITGTDGKEGNNCEEVVLVTQVTENGKEVNEKEITGTSEENDTKRPVDDDDESVKPQVRPRRKKKRTLEVDDSEDRRFQYKNPKRLSLYPVGLSEEDNKYLYDFFDLSIVNVLFMDDSQVNQQYTDTMMMANKIIQKLWYLATDDNLLTSDFGVQLSKGSLLKFIDDNCCQWLNDECINFVIHTCNHFAMYMNEGYSRDFMGVPSSVCSHFKTNIIDGMQVNPWLGEEEAKKFEMGMRSWYISSHKDYLTRLLDEYDRRKCCPKVIFMPWLIKESHWIYFFSWQIHDPPICLVQSVNHFPLYFEDGDSRDIYDAEVVKYRMLFAKYMSMYYDERYSKKMILAIRIWIETAILNQQKN